MKKLIICGLLLIASVAWAQAPIYYETNPTLEWNAVVADSDGNPFLPGDLVEYEVYLWDMAVGDPVGQPVAAYQYFGVTTQASQVLGFGYRADWAVILRTKHTDGGANVTYSALSYTTVAVDTDSGVPFVYVPVLVWQPMPPQGLRDSGI